MLNWTNATSSTVATSMTMESRLTLLSHWVIGKISAQTPMIKRILAVFEPTTLPSAISDEPARAARTETRSSGIEVPKPTMTNETINVGIASRDARATAPRKSHSAPK